MFSLGGKLARKYASTTGKHSARNKKRKTNVYTKYKTQKKHEREKAASDLPRLPSCSLFTNVLNLSSAINLTRPERIS